MTEKELFAKSTFIDLFKMNEVDRIEREDELYIQAKKLDVEKRFKESMKKYEKLLNDKISIGESGKLPDCKYDIKDYNWGNYTCNVNVCFSGI